MDNHGGGKECSACGYTLKAKPTAEILMWDVKKDWSHG